LESKEARERDVVDSSRKYNEITHLREETLPKDQQIYRVKAFTAVPKAGVALNEIDCFRDLLEDNTFCLSDRRNMHDFILSF
jgi:phosphodiesterase/alkaline phosphatase D-like protein